AANDELLGLNPFLVGFNGFGFGQAIVSGPSLLRFNATGGATYYIVADTKPSFGPPTGEILVNWAFHPSVVFRFASEESIRSTGFAVYQVSDTEGVAAGDDSTFQTYYHYNAPGALVTVTRVAGSSGRVLVDYATVDDTAIGGVDYVPAQGTLVFD